MFPWYICAIYFALIILGRKYFESRRSWNIRYALVREQQSIFEILSFSYATLYELRYLCLPTLSSLHLLHFLILLTHKMYSVSMEFRSLYFFLHRNDPNGPGGSVDAKRTVCHLSFM